MSIHCLYTCPHHAHAHSYAHDYVHVDVHVCTHVCTHANACLCTCLCMCLCTGLCTCLFTSCTCPRTCLCTPAEASRDTEIVTRSSMPSLASSVCTSRRNTGTRRAGFQHDPGSIHTVMFFSPACMMCTVKINVHFNTQPGERQRAVQR